MVKRVAKYPIDDLFLSRCSPRAMSGEAIGQEELMTLFEAARWAPSSYNGQPWRFIYAMRDTKEWSTLFDLLIPFNKSWAKNAAALVVIISRTTFEFNNTPSRTHSFDTGAAWENLALQGLISNLVVHGMEGFSYVRAKETLRVPDDYSVEAMVAVGKPGDKKELPDDLQKAEKISDRRPLQELVFKGIFGNFVT